MVSPNELLTGASSTIKDPSKTIKNAADDHLLKLLRDDLTSVNKRLDRLEDRIEDVRDEVVSRIHALSVQSMNAAKGIRPIAA